MSLPRIPSRAGLALACAAGLALAAALGSCGGPTAGPTVAITVDDDGFSPATVHARRGRPLTLIVTRRSDETCADSAIFGPQRRIALPMNRPVEIPVPTGRDTTIRYTCPMNMFKGRIVVE